MLLTQRNIFPPERVLIVAEMLPSNPPGSIVSHVGTAPATVNIELDMSNADHVAAAAELDKRPSGRTLVGVPVYEFTPGAQGENLEQITFDNLQSNLAAGETVPAFPGLGRTFLVRVP